MFPELSTEPTYPYRDRAVLFGFVSLTLLLASLAVGAWFVVAAMLVQLANQVNLYFKIEDSHNAGQPNTRVIVFILVMMAFIVPSALYLRSHEVERHKAEIGAVILGSATLMAVLAYRILLRRIRHAS